MRPNFAAVRGGHLPYAEAIRGLDRTALATLTADSYDDIGEIVAGVTDAGVSAVPFDPSLEDQHAGEEAWTLGHVVAHLTATNEAAAALAATLTRGVMLPTGLHLRAEVPWLDIATARQLTARLAESRRICLAFLDTWPDAPDLDQTMTFSPTLGPLHAVGVHVLGLMHTDDHRPQLRQIMRQTGNQGHAREIGKQSLPRSRPAAVRSGGWGRWRRCAECTARPLVHRSPPCRTTSLLRGKSRTGSVRLYRRPVRSASWYVRDADHHPRPIAPNALALVRSVLSHESYHAP